MTEDDRSRTVSPTRYTKATHLTEFYPYLNGGTLGHSALESTDSSSHKQPYHSPSGMHSRKQSLSSYTSFTPSTLDFRSLVTKTEITHTTESLEELLTASEKYTKALSLVAEAAGDFGAALERTAKCKGAGTAAEGLLSAGGLFFLVANHQQLLAHSVEESFEAPVRKEVKKFKELTTRNDDNFKIIIKDRVRALKQQEKENAKLSKSKTRNLVDYRTKLMQLTSHIDEIDKLKHDYYQTSFELVQETSSKVLTQVGSVVRAQVEIYEGIAKKGWSGGGLDELIAQCPDPFTTAEDDDDEDEVEHHEIQDSPSSVASANLNSTLRQKPELSCTDQGISFNRGLFATNPVLSHQQSIQTLQTAVPMTASTPIMMSPKSDTQDITMATDDNSFSLPVPGSARLKTEAENSNDSHTENMLSNSLSNVGHTSEETEECSDANDDNEEALEEGGEEEKSTLLPAAALERFPIENEWRDSTDEVMN